ncbi:MAG: PLDc N-terminal domain-containing protein [Defluviitaleaceae bacterium]|nr:PLDc N-terminal domain-containing protein [Defluviitaleaceae bacterium]
MDTRTLILILAPIVLVNLILQIVAVVSIARKNLPWGQKWFWLPLLLVNLLGPIIYFVAGSNILDEKAAEYQETQGRNQ